MWAVRKCRCEQDQQQDRQGKGPSTTTNLPSLSLSLHPPLLLLPSPVSCITQPPLVDQRSTALATASQVSRLPLISDSERADRPFLTQQPCPTRASRRPPLPRLSASSSSSSNKADKKDDSKKPNDDDEDSDPSLARSYNTSVSAPPLHLVVVHPLVLLSVVDHYNRVAKDTSKRVVGVLLGESHAGKVDVTNSYAVPFEEDVKDSSAWYIDRQYHEDMHAMFKKVNASEKILGWYSTGPKLKSTDIHIHELFRSYCHHPILVIIDVNPQHNPLEIPTLAYMSVESSPDQQRQSRRQFAHLPSEIGAYEAEEVGVEHLLRNIRETTESSLGEQVNAKLVSLKGLGNRLADIHDYLGKVEKGDMPVRHEIIARVQDMMNLLPAVDDPRLKQAMSGVVNDNTMVIYVSSLVRSILALHDLILNKLNNQRVERAERDKEKGDEPGDSKKGDSDAEKGTDKGKDGEGTGKEKDEQKKKEEEEKKQ